MKKDYFKINFTYLQDCATVGTYGIVRAWSAETAKQLLVSEMSQLHKNVKVTGCVKLTYEEYKKIMFS